MMANKLISLSQLKRERDKETESTFEHKEEPEQDPQSFIWDP